MRRFTLAIVPVLFALAAAAVVGSLMAVVLGHNPITAVTQVVGGIQRSPFGVVPDIADILYRATPLIFAGLALSLSFQAGMVNIGGQGQFIVGAFLCGLAGSHPWQGLSYGLLFLCFAGAFIGGGVWAYIAGVMRGRRGAHEVITTIMLNFVAIYLSAYLLSKFFRAPGDIPQMNPIWAEARLSRLGALFAFVPAYSPLNVSFFIALATILVVYWLLWRTKFGYELRVVGSNPDAAAAAGIDCAAVRERVMFLSGGLIGLASVNLILGTDFRFVEENARDYGYAGFMAIAVALMARNHPFAVLPAAIFFAALGRLEFLLKIHTRMPREIVLVLQAVVIMALLLCHTVLKRRK